MAIRLGVSLYSYREAWYREELDMRGCIRELASLGATGVELFAGYQNIGHNHPDLSDWEIARFRDLLEEFGIEPVCFDSMFGWSPHRGRELTYAEARMMVEKELKLLSRIGFRFLRMPYYLAFQRPLMADCLSMAEYYGVTFGLEVHAPMTMRCDRVTSFVELIEAKKTRFATLIPDLGIYSNRLILRLRENALREGAREECLREIDEAYAAKTLSVLDEAKLSEPEKAYLKHARSQVMDDPELLVPLAPYIGHIHAKFNEVNAGGRDTNIAYERIIPVLQRIGYDGYLCSEYEGQAYYQYGKYGTYAPEVEQVRRQHALLRSLLQ